MFGQLQLDAPFDDPDSYRFDHWRDGLDGTLMRSLLTGARQIAERGAA